MTKSIWTDTERRCYKCKEFKLFELFVKDKRCKNGISGTCTDCHRKNNKVYNDNHKDEIAERDKKYRLKNKDKIKEYYENNKEEIAEKKRIKAKDAIENETYKCPHCTRIMTKKTTLNNHLKKSCTELYEDKKTYWKRYYELNPQYEIPYYLSF